MKRQIDTIIRNTLRKGRDLYLPEVGTLIVRRKSAVRTSSKRMEAPYKEVLFTGENRGESIVDIIVRITSVTHGRAMDIYSQWLQLSQRDGVVSIDGVGVVRDRKFEADESLAGVLNPSRRDFVALRPQTHTLVYVLASLCVLFAVGVGGYMLYANGAFDGVMTTEQVVVAEVEPSVEPIAELIQEQIAEPESIATVEPSPVVDPSQTEPVVADTTADNALQPMLKGASYAVWGVYAERANAERYMKIVNTRFEGVYSKVYIYGERYMVAVCECSSRSECVRYVSALKSGNAAFKDMWVYTNN